jgi:hypothetical protein
VTTLKSKTNTHPWRETLPGAKTIDPVVSSRSGQFAAFLETLPAAERRQIEAAERAYVLKANAATSTQQSTARDYASGMFGNEEGANDQRYFG